MKKINIVIFGTGKIANRLMEYKLKPFVNILYFCDNNPDKLSSSMKGYRVESPTVLKAGAWDYIILALLQGLDDVVIQLMEYGISQDKIIIPSWENIEYERGIIDSLFCIPKESIKNRLNELTMGLDYVREALGRVESRQISAEKKKIENSEFKVYSQWGEDGIIKWLTQHVEIRNKVFVEFGCSNYLESNTRYLMIDQNWSGLIMDGSEDNIQTIKEKDFYWRYNVKAVQAFITAENINQLIESNGLSGEIGLLSVDIDGNDYWVLKAIDIITPAIIICEYNHRFGGQDAVTIPYDPKFQREKAHYSCVYCGVSLKGLELLGKEKGYSLVAVNSNANNAFFVRNDLLNDSVKPIRCEDVFENGKFREARDEQGNLSFMDIEDELKVINSLPLVRLN